MMVITAKKLFIFTLLILLASACEAPPESFYQNDLSITQESDVYLSIEDQPDGTGRAYQHLELNCLRASSLFAILRQKSDHASLGAMEVEWSNPQGGLSIEFSRSSEGRITAQKSGAQTLRVRYNDQFSVYAEVMVQIKGECELPIAPYEYFHASDAQVDAQGRVYALKGRQLALDLYPKGKAPTLEADTFPYIRFSGEDFLASEQSLGISGNSERTVIAVALPEEFGQEYDPYNPPINTSPTMLGFGTLDGLRSVYDFNFYGRGEFFTNFYGPTAGYDDSYTYSSPLATRGEIQIFTSRYQHIVNQYYGQNSSYINGALGNQVWTRLDSKNGPLYLGRGAYASTNYVSGFEGRLYEVIIYNRALEDDELDQVHRYLIQKYQL